MPHQHRAEILTFPHSHWTEARLARSYDKNRPGYLPAGNRVEPSQRATDRASTATCAVKEEVNGTSQALHARGGDQARRTTGLRVRRGRTGVLGRGHGSYRGRFSSRTRHERF